MTDQIDALYDSFGPAGQDMTRAEFRREFTRLTDGRQMRKDLQDIMGRQQQEQTLRLRIGGRTAT